MDCDLQTVSLDRIETADRTFQITTSIDKPDLKPFIGSAGLLQPPLLLPKEDKWIVVCGFRRIEACNDLKIRQIPAWILAADHSRNDNIRIAIADNASQRSLNVVEQARALGLICSTADRVQSLEMAAAFGLPASRKTMNRIMPVAQMSQPLQEGLLTGQIALPVALQIHRMGGDDAQELSTFFLSIHTGLNVQRELMDRIIDICRRDRISIAELIHAKAIAAILKDTDAPMPQRVQQLRGHLKEQRYPELSKTENRYQDLVKSLRLNSRLQLQPPPFFEGKTYRLSLSIESRKQLKSLKADLDRLIDHPSILPE